MLRQTSKPAPRLIVAAGRSGKALALICLGVWLCLAVPRAQAGTAVQPELANACALVVGVADYQAANGAAGSRKAGVNDLRYAAQDAAKIRGALIKAGLPAANIRLLQDSEATAAHLRQGLAWLEQASARGRLALFYFSGHGAGDVPDLDGDEAVRAPGDRFDEALLPYDAVDLTRVQAKTIARDNQLRKRYFAHLIVDDELSAFAASCPGRVVMVIDACYSGGVNLGAEESLGTGEPRLLNKAARTMRQADYALLRKGAPAGGNGGRQQRSFEVPGNVIFLAACQEGQVALDDDVLKSSWFTYGLLQAITSTREEKAADSDGDHRVTLADAFIYAAAVLGKLSTAKDISPLLLLSGQAVQQRPMAVNLDQAQSMVLAQY